MHSADFQKTIIVNSDSNDIFAALTTGIPEWWTASFEGSGEETGGEFTVHFGTTFKKMKVSELVPERKIVWDCLESYIDVPELSEKTEWVGTRIVWEILPGQEATTIHLTHIGLTEQIECYNICVQGWDSFVESLRKLLVTGKGTPYLEPAI